MKQMQRNKLIYLEPTDKQLILIDFYHRYVHAEGKEPTIQEVANELKVAIPTAHQHIKLLKRKGFLLRFIYCPYCGESL